MTTVARDTTVVYTRCLQCLIVLESHRFDRCCSLRCLIILEMHRFDRCRSLQLIPNALYEYVHIENQMERETRLSRRRESSC